MNAKENEKDKKKIKPRDQISAFLLRFLPKVSADLPAGRAESFRKKPTLMPCGLLQGWAYYGFTKICHLN